MEETYDFDIFVTTKRKGKYSAKDKEGYYIMTICILAILLLLICIYHCCCCLCSGSKDDVSDESESSQEKKRTLNSDDDDEEKNASVNNDVTSSGQTLNVGVGASINTCRCLKENVREDFERDV